MAGMPRPHLSTPRLDLVPLGKEHLEDLVALDGDAEVMRYLTGRARTREEVLERMESWLAPELDDAGLGWWAGHERTAPDRFLGWWLLEPRDDLGDGSRKVAELGYRLQRHAWSRGLATEGGRALLLHAFDTLGMDEVVAETMAVNLGSRGVMRRLGMRHLRTEVREWDEPLPGAEEGEVVHGITAREWRSAHEGPAVRKDDRHGQ